MTADVDHTEAIKRAKRGVSVAGLLNERKLSAQMKRIKKITYATREITADHPPANEKARAMTAEARAQQRARRRCLPRVRLYFFLAHLTSFLFEYKQDCKMPRSFADDKSIAKAKNTAMTTHSIVLGTDIKIPIQSSVRKRYEISLNISGLSQNKK